MIIRITIISIAPYLTGKGEHSALYKIYKNVFIKLKQIRHNHIVFFAHDTLSSKVVLYIERRVIALSESSGAV